MDIEQSPGAEKHFINTDIRNIFWSGVTVTVPDRKNGQTRSILNNMEGIVEAGKYDICTQSQAN
jgi:hypothetical protein